MQNLARHERSPDIVQSEASDEFLAGKRHIQLTFLGYYHDYWEGNQLLFWNKLFMIAHIRELWWPYLGGS